MKRLKHRKRLHVRPLVIALLLVCLWVAGFVPLAAQALSPPALQTSRGASFDPLDPCGTGTMPNEIQITSGTAGDVIQVPTTSVLVDPCTLSFLVSGGDASTVEVQVYGNLPDFFVSALKQVVVTHAHDLWNTDLSCPAPENGVFFNVTTPPFPLIFPFIYFDGWQMAFPAIGCGT